MKFIPKIYMLNLFKNKLTYFELGMIRNSVCFTFANDTSVDETWSNFSDSLTVDMMLQLWSSETRLPLGPVMKFGGNVYIFLNLIYKRCI